MTCEQDVNECGIYAGTDLGCQNGATCVNTQEGFTYVYGGRGIIEMHSG